MRLLPPAALAADETAEAFDAEALADSAALAVEAAALDAEALADVEAALDALEPVPEPAQPASANPAPAAKVPANPMNDLLLSASVCFIILPLRLIMRAFDLHRALDEAQQAADHGEVGVVVADRGVRVERVDGRMVFC